ncbi:MAG: hypothetical protein ACLGIV_00290 [Actinomycetes bacterium]
MAEGYTIYRAPGTGGVGTFREPQDCPRMDARRAVKLLREAGFDLEPGEDTGEWQLEDVAVLVYLTPDEDDDSRMVEIEFALHALEPSAAELLQVMSTLRGIADALDATLCQENLQPVDDAEIADLLRAYAARP